MDSFWVILTGALVASCGALLGCYLVLRKMTMIGDAISHAVLPGIVIAWLLSQTTASLPMLLGAAASGMLVTLLIEWLNKRANLQNDAAIGVSFTWLFAIGIILLTALGNKVDLDQDCVLYGAIEFVPFETWHIAGLDIPQAVCLLVGLFIVIILFIRLAYKPLLVTSFDPVFATAIGLSTTFWHYLLMGLVSVTTVISFESVGAILVIAFLVGPAATAYLLTTRLKHMLLLAIIAGIIAAGMGYLIAVWIDGSVAGAMTVAIGLEVALAVVWNTWKRRRRWNSE